MATRIGRSRELKPIGYELFIGALSILSITNLVLMYLFRQDEDVQQRRLLPARVCSLGTPEMREQRTLCQLPDYRSA